MKHFLLSCLLLAGLSASAQKAPRPSTKILDEKDGFRDVKFGSPVTQVEGLIQVGSDKEIYQRPSDALTIGEAKLKSISYYAHNGVIYAVAIQIEGQENSYPVLQTLQATYGPGYKSNPYISDYSWTGTKDRMSFDENSISHDATLFIYNVALFRQRMVDEETKAKAAKSDL